MSSASRLPPFRSADLDLARARARGEVGLPVINGADQRVPLGGIADRSFQRGGAVPEPLVIENDDLAWFQLMPEDRLRARVRSPSRPPNRRAIPSTKPLCRPADFPSTPAALPTERP